MEGTRLRFYPLLSCCLVVMVVGQASPAQTGIVPGQTIQVTRHPGIQQCPSISGDVVVWQDDRDGIFNIFGYSLTTGQEFPIATGGANKVYPQIAGNVVVWREGNGAPYSIKGKDLATGASFTVETGLYNFQGTQYYTIAGRKVYYAAELGSYPRDYEIYCRDIDTGVRTMISSDNGSDHTDPDARDGYLVWMEHPREYILDLDTGNQSKVTLPALYYAPVVARHNLFYTDTYNHICSYDFLIGVFSQISSAPSVHPSADGSIVVWTDFTYLPSRYIRGIDISTEDLFDAVAVSSPGGILFNQQCMEIDDMHIAWTWTNDTYDEMHVFVTELVPEPATLSLLGTGVGAMWIKRRRR